MKNQPPAAMIEAARLAAIQSPCQKSKRGAVIYTDLYLDDTEVALCSSGFNRAPGDLGCTGTRDCFKHCAMRCNHAEERALRTLATTSERPLVMLHVKVVEERVVAGGGPGCVMCSRAIYDSGIIHGIWLYQDLGPARWQYWEAMDFHLETCAALGIPT